ncbi:hypothetical protein NL676_008587 [Syzygium grande]|nr:hypothetical protein NL676_008587 [Syzygium grande]
MDFNSGCNSSDYAFVTQKGNNRFYEGRGGRSNGKGRGYDNGRGRGLGYQGRNRGYRPYDMNQEAQGFRQQNFSSGLSQGFKPYASSSQRYQDVKSYPSPNSPENKNYQEERAHENVRVACQICKCPRHDALRCWYRYDNSFQSEKIPTALAAMHLEDPKGSEWYLDTGATNIITLKSCEKHKGYRCLVPTDGRIYISRNVTFDEGLFPFAQKLNDVFPQYTVLYKKWVEEVKFMGSYRKSQPSNIAHDNSGLLQDNHVLEIGQIRVPYKETPMSQMSPTTELENMCVHEQYEETQDNNSCEPPISDAVTFEQPRITSTHQIQTRRKSGIVKPNPKYSCLVEYRVPAKPKSIKSTLAHEAAITTSPGITRKVIRETSLVKMSNGSGASDSNDSLRVSKAENRAEQGTLWGGHH